MENEQTLFHGFDINLIYEYFVGLERQGPGSTEATLRALSFIGNLSNESKIADLGCGTGTQTMVLAQNGVTGNITGVDRISGFIDIFNDKAKKLNLQDKVKSIVCSMDDLPFQNDEFDLIWSEGAIGSIGFEKGINYWKGFLKKNGYIALTYESWFTDERPAEIEKWWLDACPEIDTIGHNISTMQKAGYVPVAAFTLHESCWVDTYFSPQKALRKAFLEKHTGNKAAEDLVKSMIYEEELYSKYKQYYGYVFYIGKKI